MVSEVMVSLEVADEIILGSKASQTCKAKVGGVITVDCFWTKLISGALIEQWLRLCANEQIAMGFIKIKCVMIMINFAIALQSSVQDCNLLLCNVVLHLSHKTSFPCHKSRQ